MFIGVQLRHGDCGISWHLVSQYHTTNTQTLYVNILLFCVIEEVEYWLRDIQQNDCLLTGIYEALTRLVPECTFQTRTEDFEFLT